MKFVSKKPHFEYLRKNVFCDVSYNITFIGTKYYQASHNEFDTHYISEIKGSIRRPHGIGVIGHTSFKMPCKHHLELPITFFTKLMFEEIGVDSLRELEALSSGEEQLKIMDEIRRATRDYFSNRPK